MTEQTANGSDELFEASDFEQANESADEPTVQASDEESATSAENQEVDAAATDDESANTGAQTANPIDEFLATKGIKSDDPEALRKVVEMYQGAEKGFYEKSQRAAQLERQLRAMNTPQQPNNTMSAPDMTALNEVRKLQRDISIERWKNAKNLTPEAEQKMIEWCAQPMTDAAGNIIRDPNGNPIPKGVNIVSGALSLDDAFRLSGADTMGVDNLKEQMRAEARKEMVARQNAKRPMANATESAQFGKADEKDYFRAGLTSV